MIQLVVMEKINIITWTISSFTYFDSVNKSFLTFELCTFHFLSASSFFMLNDNFGRTCLFLFIYWSMSFFYLNLYKLYLLIVQCHRETTEYWYWFLLIEPRPCHSRCCCNICFMNLNISIVIVSKKCREIDFHCVIYWKTNWTFIYHVERSYSHTLLFFFNKKR